MSGYGGFGSRGGRSTFQAASLLAAAAAFSCLLAPAGCTSAQRTFDTPAAAAEALAGATAARDRAAMRRVLGPDFAQLGSGDERRDRADFQRFAAALERQRRVVAREDGLQVLLVGPEEFEFPAPIVRDGAGYRFDTAAGIEEMRCRRIGWGELSAIATCLDLVNAQREYFAADPDNDGVRCFAARLRSSAGLRDGLWWPDEEGAPLSPLGPVVAAAVESGELLRDASGPQPYRGYYFRVLTGSGASAPGGARSYVDEHGRMTGGFALVAWPAEYGSTGIMTFLAGEDGAVYERDLGAETAREVQGIETFDPGGEWTKVE